MTTMANVTRRTLGALGLAATATLGACQSAGGIGEAIGSVLGGMGGQAQGQQVAGAIAGVDVQNRQIGFRQGNGQTVGIAYDDSTRVVFQNQRYPVTALEAGDSVIVRVIDRGNNSYYTDSVHVTRSVSDNGGGATTGTSGTANAQSFQGAVRQVDRTNGLFTIELTDGRTLTVSMPYNARSADVQRFQALRSGDTARLYGVYLNNSRIELRQFY